MMLLVSLDCLSLSKIFLQSHAGFSWPKNLFLSQIKCHLLLFMRAVRYVVEARILEELLNALLQVPVSVGRRRRHTPKLLLAGLT